MVTDTHILHIIYFVMIMEKLYHNLNCKWRCDLSEVGCRVSNKKINKNEYKHDIGHLFI